MEGPWKWWGRRRLAYNAVLIAAGFISAVLLMAVLALGCHECEMPDMAIFTGPAVFFLFVLLANLFYFLGPLIELALRPRDPTAYRNLAFWAGTIFSVALLFAPVVALFFVVTGRPAP